MRTQTGNTWRDSAKYTEYDVRRSLVVAGRRVVPDANRTRYVMIEMVNKSLNRDDMTDCRNTIEHLIERSMRF